MLKHARVERCKECEVRLAGGEGGEEGSDGCARNCGHGRMPTGLVTVILLGLSPWIGVEPATVVDSTSVCACVLSCHVTSCGRKRLA